MSDESDALIERLRSARTDAMRGRDRAATSALRTTLSAIANAEAVDPDAAPTPDSTTIAGAVTGVAASDVERRQLSSADVLAIVQSEIDDLRRSADDYDRLGRAEQAAELRHGAEAIERVLSV